MFQLEMYHGWGLRITRPWGVVSGRGGMPIHELDGENQNVIGSGRIINLSYKTTARQVDAAPQLNPYSTI